MMSKLPANPHWLRWVIFIGYFTVSLFLAGCDSNASPFSSQSSLLAALERKSGLIAFVGIDGNIYTVNQGGGKLTNVTNDAVLSGQTDPAENQQVYLFPTWSPGNRKLAFTGISGPVTSPEKVTINVANADGSELTEVYASEEALPIYVSWSPANQDLAILSSIQQAGLILESVPAEGGEGQVLDVGQPLYWDWSPDGTQLLVHIGGQNPGAKLSILQPEERVYEELLEMQPSSFQAPAWSPSGGQFLVAGDIGDGNNNLYLTDVKGEIQEDLAALEDGSVAFAWSPDGSKIAYITGERLQTQGVLGPVTVIDLEDPQNPLVAGDEQAIAFFWSPDSKKIAYFVPTLASRPSEGSATGEEDSQDSESEEQILVLVLFVMDVDSGETKELRLFQPTIELFNILGFFDQYHRSATIWSPDSQNLVITATTGDGSDGVWVINASGSLDPRPIARGSLAFWSWE